MRIEGWRGSSSGGFELYAQTLIAGYVHQDVREENGARHGHSLLMGTSVSYLYRRLSYEGFRDRLGILGLPGASFDIHVFFPHAQMRFKGRVNADFAGVHSTNYSQWEQEHPEEISKSILRKQSYYYGWGYSTSLYAEFLFPLVEIGGSFTYGYWNSDEGLDRDQASLTADIKLEDRLFEGNAWLRIFFGKGIYLEAAYRFQTRLSELDDFPREDRRLRQSTLRVGFMR